MDPEVCAAEGMALLRCGLREGAGEYAYDLFDWLIRGGYRPVNEQNTYELLSAFGYDPMPTIFLG